MARSHTLLARSIHWSFIGLYGYGLLKQLDDVSDLEAPGLLAFEVGFAALFLAVVLARYLYMRRFETFLGARRPPSPAHRRFARLVHVSMYLCLGALPLSGLAIAGLFSMGTEGGLLMGAAVGVHEVSASLSYALIGLHVTAALLSRLKGEGVWSAMVPVWREERPPPGEGAEGAGRRPG